MKPVAGAHSLDFTTNVDAHDEVVLAAVEFAPVVSGKETRTEHAKTFIFCGPATPMAEWQRSGGLGLEIYPQGWNPGRRKLKPGDPMWFIVVDDSANKPLRDVPMELYRAGAGRIAEASPIRTEA